VKIAEDKLLAMLGIANVTFSGASSGSPLSTGPCRAEPEQEHDNTNHA
jgi:hypothetical protein